jgi:hypothetical protein
MTFGDMAANQMSLLPPLSQKLTKNLLFFSNKKEKNVV